MSNMLIPLLTIYHFLSEIANKNIGEKNNFMTIQATIITAMAMNREHMEKLLDARPYLKDHAPERILTCALIRGFLWTDKDTGRTILPHQILAGMQGKHSTHSQGGKLIKSTQEHVLPGLEIKDYCNQEGKCRSVMQDGLEPWMRKMAQVPPKDLLLVSNLKVIKAYSEATQWRLYNKIVQEQSWLYPVQKMMAETCRMGMVETISSEEHNFVF